MTNARLVVRPSRGLCNRLHTVSSFEVLARRYELRDELPRTDAGKLLKRVLRDEFWRDRATAV